ncbi:unnamed protein product [Sphagnum jensenii]
MNLSKDFDTSSQPPSQLLHGGSVNTPKRQPVALVILGAALLAALIFLPALGAYNMLDPTDSFFVEAPREMLILHHYMTPLINYADWFDKPSFPFLLTVLTYKIFDEPLSMFIGVAMLAFALALFNGKKNYLLVAYFMLGLAALCKGPIGLVLAGGSLFCYGLLEVAHENATFLKLFNFMRTLNPVAGLAIVLLVSAPYYIAAHITTNGAFTQEFFLHQNVGRFEAVPTKLPTYIVPMCPAFAVIVATNLDMLLRLKRKSYFQFSAGVMAIAAIAAQFSCLAFCPFQAMFRIGLWGMVAIICIFQACQFFEARANRLVNALRLQCAGTVFVCATLIPYIFCLFFWSHQARIDRLVTRALTEKG